MNKNAEYIELEYKQKKRTTFIHVDLIDNSIWVDIKYFPETVFLCACADGTSARIAKCGLRKQSRTFLNIDWLIFEWGGPVDLVELIKKQKERILKEVPELKIKHKA